MSDYTAEQRRQMAKDGEALPDGSFPIKTKADVESAVKMLGLYKGDKAKAKAHIVKRAKAIGATDALPPTWKPSSLAASADTLVTIPDVEICKVGNWASALSGRVPITGDDLEAMVAAAIDPEVDAGPVKIGHVDPRFDGEPALGWLQNLRNRGGTLVADIVDAPSKMEPLIRSAFRRRSAEIAWNVKTPSGKTYKAALAGLALLGVTPPAVKGLADVVSRYSAPEAEALGAVTIVDGDDGELAELHASAINAQAAFEARRAFLAGSGELPNGAPHSQPNDPPTEALVNDDEVRAKLGLPAEVPVTDQIRTVAEQQTANEAASAALAAQQAAADQAAAAAAEAARKGAEGAPTTTIDAGALAELQRQAADGAQAMKVLRDQEREETLTAALSAGKIAPASVDSYRKLYDAQPAETKALLAGLPVVFSTVDSAGSMPTTHLSGGGGGPDDEAWTAFEQSLKAAGL